MIFSTYVHDPHVSPLLHEELVETRDAEAVVEALEGLAGAADAPVAVGAHEALAAGAVEVVLAAAVVAGPLGARLKVKWLVALINPDFSILFEMLTLIYNLVRNNKRQIILRQSPLTNCDCHSRSLLYSKGC